MTATMSIFANATGGRQPNESAPKNAPASKYTVPFVVSFSSQAPFRKKTIHQTIKQTAETIAIQYKAGATIL